LRTKYDAEQDLNAFYSKLGVKTKAKIPKAAGKMAKPTAVSKGGKGTELETILDCEMNWE